MRHGVIIARLFGPGSLAAIAPLPLWQRGLRGAERQIEREVAAADAGGEPTVREAPKRPAVQPDVRVADCGARKPEAGTGGALGMEDAADAGIRQRGMREDHLMRGEPAGVPGTGVRVNAEEGDLEADVPAMAFGVRRKGGGVLWSGGSYRRPDGRTTRLLPAEVTFSPLARWRSRKTGARYPVTQLLRIRLPEGVRDFPLRPIFPDQEVDARAAGQPVYWEGAVRANRGRGYLELTGYADPLRM